MRERHIWRIISQDPEETEELGYSLGTLLSAGDILGLSGRLGTGKTTLTRGIVRGLEAGGHVSSPTFTLLREYPGRLPVYHFDLYRLSGGDELLELGFDEYAGGRGVVIIEWVDRALDILPPEWLRIDLVFGSEPLQREVVLTPYGGRYAQIVDRLRRKAAGRFCFGK